MRALIMLRCHGCDFKIRMSRKYLAVYYVQKNTVCITRQIWRPRSLIDSLMKRDQQNGVPASQPEQEIPYRELLKDIAEKYMTVSEEEVKEMTREYCSRINAYRTKLTHGPESLIIEESQPVNNLKKDMKQKDRQRTDSLPKESTKYMVQNVIKRNEEYFKQLQMLEIADQGMDQKIFQDYFKPEQVANYQTGEPIQGQDMVPESRKSQEEHTKQLQSLENATPQEDKEFARDLEMQKDILQDYRKRIEGYKKQLQTGENSVPKEDEENVKAQTSALKETKTRKKEEVEMDRDIVQEYRKRNEEYMKQLQTLENTVPQEDNKKKTAKKGEIEMDRDVMQEYRKQNEEYMKQLQTLENSVLQENEENVRAQTSSLKETKTRKKQEDIIQQYRKRNEEYMKQLQTLENTVPQEDDEKKTAKKGEVEMDRDVMQEYRKQNEEYIKQIQALENAVPQEDEENVKVEASAHIERKNAAKVEVEFSKTREKKKMKMDKNEETPVKPKRPYTAYMLFVKDRIAINPSVNGKGGFKMIAKEWKTLEAEQKQVYEAKAIELRTSYEREIHNWETEMIKQKNLSVVRRATLKKISLPFPK